MASKLALVNANGKVLTLSHQDTYNEDNVVDVLSTAYTIETINDFATVPTGFKTVIVKDDNRGGTFIWSATGTANGGTVFAGATGYWNRQYSGAVNVKWFGAKDGLDSTTAIQGAITYALSISGVLYIPAGNYIYNASSFVINLVGLSKQLKIYGDGVKSIITVDANNKIFDVRCSYNFPFYLENLTFTLSNIVTNSNSTLLYLTNNTSWGASYNISGCIFNGFTNCAIHSLRAFRSSVSMCNIIGSSSYYGVTNVLPTYDDAGIRMWGADGTTTSQDHSFSNVNEIEKCLIGNVRYGIDGWGIFNSTIDTCTFEPCFVGVINRINTFGTSGAGITTNKSGFGVGSLSINNSWFEQNSLYHYTDRDLDATTELDINPTFKSIYYMNDIASNYFNLFDRKRNDITLSLTNEILKSFKQMNGVAITTADPTFKFFYALTNNPDIEYYKYSSIEAYNKPRIRAEQGISFGANNTPATTLAYYEEGVFTPTLYIGATIQDIGVNNFGTYTRIGNRVNFEISIYKELFVKSGTGTFSIKTLPFVSKSGYATGGASITYFNLFTPTTVIAYGEVAVNSNVITLLTSGANMRAALTDTMVGNGTLILKLHGTYSTT